MYRLYIGNKNYSSWSLRPWLLMSELGIEFEETLVAFDDGNSWGKFREFSPTGLVPCLVDGDAVNGETTVWESLSIVEYLAERHEGVWPGEPRARAWARSAAAEMHAGFSALRNRCPMTVGLKIELNETPPDLVQDLARLDELWTEGFDRFGGPFLAGNRFSAVDAFFAPVVFRARTYGLELGPLARAYSERLLDLAGMKRWYADGCAETYREPSHEAEIAALGRCVEDRRATPD
jgi:glutathione S-transferase